MDEMVSPFLGLKHMPCPSEKNGGICASSQCLFGHRADDVNNTLPRSTNKQADGTVDSEGATSGQADSAVRDRVSSESDTSTDSPPTKRIKTAHPTPGQGVGDQLANAGSLSKPALPTGASATHNVLSPSSTTTSSSVQSPKPVTTAGATAETTKAASAAASSSLKDRTAPTPKSSPNKTSLNPDAKPYSKSQIPASAPVSQSSTPRSSAVSNLADPASVPNGSSAASSLAQGPSVSTVETLNPRLLQPSPESHGVRYQFLELLHKEFVRLNTAVSQQTVQKPDLKPLLMTQQQLIKMALDREVDIGINKSSIYRNVVGREVLRYRKMQLDTWISERQQAVAKNAPAQNKTELDVPVVIQTGLQPSQEVQILAKVITPTEKLDAYGYVNFPPTADKIDDMRKTLDWSKGREKCDRCGAGFQVYPGRNIATGELASGGKCTYHSGKMYWPARPQNGTGRGPKKYQCCNEDEGESAGCTVGETHVWKTSAPERLALLWNFVPTPANNSPETKKAVAFDCEMGYTVRGMEVIRLTVTSWPDGGEVLDVLVQPFGEILDLNSRYSGVFPEDMVRAVPWTKDCKPPRQNSGERKILQKVSSPEAARDLFFSFINPDTVLVGHGLENDLNAMRMIHRNIVDTVLLHPHKRGLPLRNSLKYLMQSLLNRKIQVDIGEGHDSAEDAKAAGDLVRLTVQKEWNSMKVKGWRFFDDVLCAPDQPDPPPRKTSSEESLDDEEGGASLHPGQAATARS